MFSFGNGHLEKALTLITSVLLEHVGHLYVLLSAGQVKNVLLLLLTLERTGFSVIGFDVRPTS